MQVIRTIKEADESGIVQVHLPSSFGRRVEVIILSLSEGEAQDASGQELMKLQETSGFARGVLGHPAEDIWNDL